MKKAILSLFVLLLTYTCSYAQTGGDLDLSFGTGGKVITDVNNYDNISSSVAMHITQ